MTQTVTHLAVGSLLAGLNPRKFFDPAEMAELEASVAAKGVIQPIIVRPVEGGYAIVAGERRYRAAKKVHGDEYQIPVHVKDITSEEADELALIENIQRANMSPSEEAVAAAKILGSCEGNRDEAAKRLGWTRTTLDKRLALMNCSPSVLTALNERRIQLGHAELLAAASKDKQEKVIEKLLAAPSLPNVAQFKAQLESISKQLASAIFDKADCAGCHHNSGNQQAMFAEAVSDGHCTNGECFDRKTEEVVVATAKSLEDEYPRVQIVRPGENSTVIKLVAEGATGVGADQAEACKACKNFGAAVSAVPGKIGNVYRDQCFDTVCNTQKVAARLKAEKEAQQPTAKPEDKTTTTAKGAGKEAGKTATKTSATGAAAVTTVQDTQRVVDYRVGIWRKALKKELFADQRENLSLLLAVMMTRGGSNVISTKLMSAFEKLNGSRPSNSSNVGEAAGMISRASDEVRQQMLSGIVMGIVDGIEKSVLPDMMTFMDVDLAQHWKLNEEFLGLLTKSEIEVIAGEIGLKAALGEKYSKVMGGKKDEIIKALLAVEGFDYTGKIPSVLKVAQ